MDHPYVNNNSEEKEQKYQIDRPVFLHEELRSNFNYGKDKIGIKQQIQQRLSCDPVDILRTTFPIIEWLPNYKWKTDLTSDIVAGITVAIMHISQGMAYGMLADVPPVVGIYTAFFPVLIYFVFGMAKHNSMGTFAVTSLMVGVVVGDQVPDGTPEEKIQVATAVTFLCGVYQLLMYFLRLGVVSTLLSETLVSGFTTGAAVHVLCSQIKDILGLKLPRDKSVFVNIYTLINVVENITDFNYITFIIAVLTIIVSIANNEYLKPILAKKTAIPFPLELILVILGTGVSYGCSLTDYNVTVVGKIPAGLPEPAVPSFDIMGTVWSSSLMIAVVSYTISLSMGLIFAQKYNYEVDANQELLAQGLGNLTGSFFSAVTFAASLSRSSIQANAGCKSNITSAVSCSILVIILIWVGPYFEMLPKAILAGIIVVALKGLLFQVREFPKFWTLSKLDGLVWMITFLTVSIVSIDIGLMVGIGCSLLVILIKGIKPYYCLMGYVPNTGLYLDIKRYKGVEEVRDIKIFHYQGSINFASKTLFKSCLCDSIRLDPAVELAKKKKALHKGGFYLPPSFKYLILDFTGLTYIDPSGVSMLKALTLDFKKIDIPVVIAGCSEPVYGALLKCELLNSKKDYCSVFVTLHDAVLNANKTLQEMTESTTTIATIS